MGDRTVSLESVIEVVNTYFRCVLNLKPDYLIDGITSLPTVAPVVHGRWIEDPDDDWGCRCSECGLLELYQFDYCPSCGAKMDGDHT